MTTRRSLPLVELSLELFDDRAVRFANRSPKDVAVTSKRRESGTVPAWLGVAAWVEQDDVVCLDDSRSVAVSVNHDVGVVGAAEHGECGLAAVRFVSDGEAESASLDGAFGRQPL